MRCFALWQGPAKQQHCANDHAAARTRQGAVFVPRDAQFAADRVSAGRRVHGAAHMMQEATPALAPAPDVAQSHRLKLLRPPDAGRRGRVHWG